MSQPDIVSRSPALKLIIPATVSQTVRWGYIVTGTKIRHGKIGSTLT
jgi:hypothetical protein